jgi:hypothetical protein
MTPILPVLAGLALAACGGSSGNASSTSSLSPSASSATAATTTTATSTAGEVGFEGVPLEYGPAIAPASTTQAGTVDGIHCAPVEQLAYHIHAHLAVYKDGQLYSLPGGIGIPGSQMVSTSEGPVAAGGHCFYWLHTHTSDGIIHIESPTQRIYTLGEFFNEWHQPLSADQVGNVHGKITAFANGKPWTKDLRSIPLVPHAVIQFNIGEPAPPLQTVSWAGTGL